MDNKKYQNNEEKIKIDSIKNIELKNVSYRYKNRKNYSLKNISLKLNFQYSILDMILSDWNRITNSQSNLSIWENILSHINRAIIVLFVRNKLTQVS